jgi:hypothetical protein
MDAELGQGALAATADADHLLKGVVGPARDRQQAIARLTFARRSSC